MRWALGALVLVLPVSAFAQRGTGQAVTLAEQVRNAYAVSPTEADFFETEFGAHGDPVVHRRGHAIFTDVGFVLQYTSPSSRVVVSDLYVTRTIDTATHAVTKERADYSTYTPLIALTGTRTLALKTCGSDPAGTSYLCVTSDDMEFSIDGKTARVGRLQRLGNSHNPDIIFTNIHPIPPTRALPIVTAALLVK